MGAGNGLLKWSASCIASPRTQKPAPNQRMSDADPALVMTTSRVSGADVVHLCILPGNHQLTGLFAQGPSVRHQDYALNGWRCFALSC
jgi:hypothetical protein